MNLVRSPGVIRAAHTAKHTRSSPTVKRARSLGLAVLALTATVFLTSCTEVERPTVMLEGMDVEGVSSEGLELLLNLKIRNPNPFDATVTDFEYTVEVDGIEVASGGQAREVRIPSEGTVDVEIPSRLAWSGTKDVLESLTIQGKHDWEIHGNLRLKKGILSRAFEFDETGSFDGSLDVELDL